jgi:hypothetical protein
MKEKPILYRGIEYINISDLPDDQQKALNSTQPRPEPVKILIHGKVSEKCILYNDYSDWFTNVYNKPLPKGIPFTKNKNVVITKLVKNKSN